MPDSDDNQDEVAGVEQLEEKKKHPLDDCNKLNTDKNLGEADRKCKPTVR